MAIDGKTLSPWTQVYTFVALDGTNVHIHSPRLREHCIALRYPWTPAVVDVPLARSFIRDNIVDPRRVSQLTEQHFIEPIILCKTEAFGLNHPTIPDVLLVDGHHRYTRAAMDGMQTIRAWILELYQWQPFTIYNLPDYTREALNAEPIIAKPHWRKS